MRWPFRYPGDEFITNVFSDIVILLEDIKDAAVELLEKATDPIEK